MTVALPRSNESLVDCNLKQEGKNHTLVYHRTVSYEAISSQKNTLILLTLREQTLVNQIAWFSGETRILIQMSVLFNLTEGQFKNRLTSQITIKLIEKKLSSEDQFPYYN